MDWRRIPSLAALRAFEAAARHQSFTRAAAELNVTQAAIAQHVRSLEADLTENLVHKQGRGIAITDTGRHLAEHLQNGFGIIADGIEDIRARVESRPIRVTTTPTFAANWLMPRMGAFWGKYPDLQISIHPTNAVMDMRADGFDLAIRYGDGNWPGLKSEMLTDGDFWVVAHPDFVAQHNIKSLVDTNDLTWFLDGSMLERQALVEQEGVQFSSAPEITLTSNALVIAAVEAGLGLSIQPKSLVEAAVARGSLTAIFKIKQEPLSYYLVTVQGREPKGLRVLISWLKKQSEIAVSLAH